MKVTAESILSILRKDARNNITVFHRWQTVPGEGAHTVGITLNFHEPYYAEMVKPFLTVERWGNGTLGGEIYRLPREAQ